MNFIGKRLIFSSTLSIVLVNFLWGDSTSLDLQPRIFTARNRVMPALVHIEPVRTIFSTGERRHALVTGSGFIFSREGYVLTNHHVVENAEKLSCTLSNKKKLSAEIIGSDPSTDVAVIKLDLQDWGDETVPFVNLGNSDSLEVGQIVLALGSPLGLSRSVSLGVISSIDRYFEDSGSMVSPYNLWIQTDAAINPGNSGGPLIDLNGQVIGINARGVFLAENLGFAIPINLAREVAEKLLQGNTIRRSWIGLELQPIKLLREYLQKPDLQGVLVAGIDPHSPALQADIRPGDVLISINNIPLNATFDEDLPAIRKIIADLPLQEQAALEIWREGDIKKITVIPKFEPFEYQPEFECEKWGLVVKSITRQIFQAQMLLDYSGVYISAVKNGELAEKAGLRAGDVIQTINQQKITDIQEFKTIYNTLKDSSVNFIYFELLRQSSKCFAAINLKTPGN
jgi:serine protease Do